MSQQYFDLSALPIAAPGTPPVGLRPWLKTSGTVNIVEAGAGRGTGVGLAVWLNDGFTPTDNVLKIEIVLGSDGLGTVSTPSTGIIFTEDDSGSNNAFIGVGLSGQGGKTISGNGDSLSLVGTLTRNKPNKANEAFTVYLDRSTNRVYSFNDGIAVHRLVNITSAMVNYGFYLAISTLIKSIKFEDAGDTPPPYLGDIAGNDDNNIPITSGISIHNVGNINYYNFTPRHGRLCGYPVDIISLADGVVSFKLNDLDSTLGNVYNLYIAPQGASVSVTGGISFYDGDRSCTYDTALSGHSLVFVSHTQNGASNISNLNSIHHYYTINGSVTGAPAFSAMWFGKNVDGNNNSAAVTADGTLSIASLNNNVGTTTKPLYVVDGVDKKLRRFDVTFNKVNSTVMDVVEYKLPIVNVFEAELSTIYDSETVLEGVADQEPIYTEGDCLISWDTGSGWTGWTNLNGVTNAQSLTSTIYPTPFKLRMRSLGLIDKKRTAKIYLAGDVIYEWFIHTKANGSVFYPDLSLPHNEIVIDLINHTNGSSLTSALVNIINPVPYSGFDSGDTVATIQPIPNTPYVGSMEINYDRINVGLYAGADGIAPLTVPYLATWDDVISLFNDNYGTAFTVTDFPVPEGFPAGLEIATAEWSMVMNPSSLVFNGSVSLDITVAYTPLSELFYLTALKGFTLPA